MIYLLVLCIVIIIGMIIITVFNLNEKKQVEKQFYQDYKALIEECFKENTTNKDGKKKISNKIRTTFSN